MDELDGDRAGHGHHLVGTDGSGGQKCQSGPDMLTAAALDRLAVDVYPTEVVFRRYPQLGWKTANGPAEGRRHGRAGPIQHPRLERAHTVAWVSMSDDAVAARVAAARPLSTALSIVAGQPVSVQAPAR